MVVLFFSPKNRLLKKEQFINPMATVYDGVYHPPPGRFHGRYLHSSDRVGAKKVGIGSISPRAFRRRAVRYQHPLDCRAIELGKPPQGVVIYTVVSIGSRLIKGCCHIKVSRLTQRGVSCWRRACCTAPKGVKVNGVIDTSEGFRSRVRRFVLARKDSLGGSASRNSIP